MVTAAVKRFLFTTQEAAFFFCSYINLITLTDVGIQVEHQGIQNACHKQWGLADKCKTDFSIHDH